MHEKQLETQRNQAAAEKQRIDSERAALQDLLVRQRKLLAALDVIPVLGQPQLTAAQIASWFHANYRGYRLSGGTTIDQLAAMYIQEGNDEFVKGDVAFAQAVLETGAFRSSLDNNYSGIGACDSCSGEIAFPTPRDGVRAQIQHLRNYSDPGFARRQAVAPARAGPLRQRPGPGRLELRHVLRQGHRADVAVDGQGPLGDRSVLRDEGDRHLHPDGRLRRRLPLTPDVPSGPGACAARRR